MTEHSRINCGYQPVKIRYLRKEIREKSRSEGPIAILYRSEKAHMDRLFIAVKTSDLPHDFLSVCHLAHTARFFIGAIVCDNGRRDSIINKRYRVLSHTYVIIYDYIQNSEQYQDDFGTCYTVWHGDLTFKKK